MTKPKKQNNVREGRSRREFLEHTTVAAGGAVLATVSAASCTTAQEKPKGDQDKKNTQPATAAGQTTALKGSMTEYKSGDLVIPAYFARSTKQGAASAVLVIHEVFGLNDHIKSIADRIAGEGFHALAPNLFVRASEPPPKDTTDIDALRRAASSIPIEAAIKDMQAGLDHLKTIKDVRPRFASVGFCMGGGYSYQLATHTKDLAGAVIFYGRTPVELVPQVSCPLLGNFGELDQGIPPEKVREFEAALKKAGKTADIKIYPGAKHGFFNDTRPEAYNAAAAADAWQRTLKFFRERLSA
ncbi:MAG TPA: dienelactone hydrolase family protein [Pyrinomonadaceae bacterium]|jgi:carboxymethylenebutenolidase